MPGAQKYNAQITINFTESQMSTFRGIAKRHCLPLAVVCRESANYGADLLEKAINTGIQDLGQYPSMRKKYAKESN